MKINYSTQNTGAAQLGRSAETETAGQAGVGRNAPGSAGSRPDRVNLSDFSSQLLMQAQAESPERAARVHALAQQVQSGRYQPDLREVSRSIIAEALSR